MATYQVETLYHYGVLGMKWGVRRHQKKKQYNADSDKLATAVAVKVESIKDFKDTATKFKKNPKMVDKSELLAKAQKTNTAYEIVNYGIKDLQKKYKKVDFDIMTEAKTGEAYVQSRLEDDLGKTYISEFYLGYHTK